MPGWPGKSPITTALKREADALRTRYQNLQNRVSQTNRQLASLELYAKEVSLAYGIKQKLEGPADIAAEGKLVPTFAESVQGLRLPAERRPPLPAEPAVPRIHGGRFQAEYLAGGRQA